jgi:hypothetical protein
LSIENGIPIEGIPIEGIPIEGIPIEGIPMSDLRTKLIRLASEKPELRQHLLPLLRQSNSSGWGWRLTPEGLRIFQKIQSTAKKMGFLVPDSLRYSDIVKSSGVNPFGQGAFYDLVYPSPDSMSEWESEEDFRSFARRPEQAERAQLGLTLSEYNSLTQKRYSDKVQNRVQEVAQIAKMFPSKHGKPIVKFSKNGWEVQVFFPLEGLTEQG